MGVTMAAVVVTACFACFFDDFSCFVGFGSADLDVEGVLDDEVTAALDGGAPAFDCSIGVSRSCFCCTLAERRLFCAGSGDAFALNCDAAVAAAAAESAEVFEEAGVARPRFFAGITPAIREWEGGC